MYFRSGTLIRLLKYKIFPQVDKDGEISGSHIMWGIIKGQRPFWGRITNKGASFEIMWINGKKKLERQILSY